MEPPSIRRYKTREDELARGVQAARRAGALAATVPFYARSEAADEAAGAVAAAAVAAAERAAELRVTAAQLVIARRERLREQEAREQAEYQAGLAAVRLR